MTLRSIAARNTFAIIATACLTSLAVGLALFVFSEVNERSAYSTMMSAELATLLADVSESDDHSARRLEIEHIRFYYGAEVAALPDRIRSRKAGTYHDLPLNDRRWEVQVGDHHGERYVLMLDITHWENHELQVFGYGVALVLILTLLNAYISHRASRFVLGPLNDLTANVVSLDPAHGTENIPEQYQDRSIRRIAAAINLLIDRVRSAIDRERITNATTSHELRNSLGVMMGAVEILQRYELPAPGQRARDRLVRATDEMHDLVEAILQLSRESASEAGSDEFTDAIGIAESALSQLASLADANSVILSLCVEAPLRTSMPAPYLRILTVNLLRNGIEHSPGASVTLRLRADQLSVIDTGEGIDAAVRDHIFEPGFTTREDGTGIGLSLIRRITERYRVSLEVESPDTGGTAFHLTFS